MPSALICKGCKNNETPAWFARLQAHWSLGLVRALSVGTIVAVTLTMYSTCSSKQVRLRDRSQSLAEGMLLLQKTADELRQPCTLATANDCRKRFTELAAAFGASNYKFKEEARYLVDEKSPIQHAINFVDDFYNPGQQPGEYPLATLKAAPLQEAILHAREALSEPYVDADWCTPDRREAMRALAVSIDTYRYCAGVIRRFIWTTGSQRDESSMLAGKSYQECVIDEPMVKKANRLHQLVYKLDNYDHSAPWLFDSYCGDAGVSISGGPVPAATKQLLVTTAETWGSTDGTLTRYERNDAKSPWRRMGDDVPVMLGKKGLAWGRGLWQAPVRDGAISPVKVEGDGRAPAGLFTIGTLFSEAKLADAKMPVTQTDDAMFCEDRVESGEYNRLARLSGAKLKVCSNDENRKDSSTCPGELLRRSSDDVYERLFWIHHNDSPVVKGAGSCIFLHLDHATRRPTAGCTTVSSAAMDQLIAWLDPKAQPLLLQLPKEELSGVIDLP